MLDFSKQVEFFELYKLVNYTIIYIYLFFLLHLHVLSISGNGYIMLLLK